jgi:hypothetical protein
MLPHKIKEKDEVDLKFFEPALEQWYQFTGFPLLEKEKTALVARFKNPQTSKNNVHLRNEVR